MQNCGRLIFLEFENAEKTEEIALIVEPWVDRPIYNGFAGSEPKKEF